MTKIEKEINLSKYKILIVTGCIAISLISIGIAGYMYYFKSDLILRTYKCDSFAVKYDNTWHIDSKKKSKLTLKHKTGSYLEIKVISLNSNQVNKSVEELVEEIKYDITNQKQDYLLLAYDTETLKNNKYESYKLLYEEEDNNVLIIVGKTTNQMFIANYTAKSKYFDIVLDSGKNIINQIELLK